MSDWPIPSIPPIQDEWVRLLDSTLGSPATSISASGLNTAHTRLRVVFWALKDATPSGLYVRYNNDSGANYADEVIRGDGVTPSSARVTGATRTELLAGENTKAAEPVMWVSHIQKTAAANRGRSLDRWVHWGAVANQVQTGMQAGVWDNTADALSRVDVIAAGGNWDTGSRMIVAGAQQGG